MSNIDGASEITGRKIFYLRPNSAIQNRILTELAQQEYEIYSILDKDLLRRALPKFPNSIIFLDINDGMPEKDWDVWITALMEDTEIKGVSVGIITTNDDEAIKRKYLMTIKVACGYTIIKFDVDKAIAHIFETLEKVNAKGRRKYLRATIDKEANTTINVPYNGGFINGQIKDISVVGISCTLEGDPDIEKNALIKNIQVRLQGSLIKLEGIVFGSRLDCGEKVYVFLFTQRIDPDVRAKIRKYIQQNLQNKMDAGLR